MGDRVNARMGEGLRPARFYSFDAQCATVNGNHSSENSFIRYSTRLTYEKYERERVDLVFTRDLDWPLKGPGIHLEIIDSSVISL